MNAKMTSNMWRRFFVYTSLTVLLFVGLPALAHTSSAPPQQGQQAAQATAVSGKVVSIANDKRSISLEVTDNGNANTMQFVLDENTQVTGRVHVGSDATVQYQTGQDGKLVALNIAPKSQ
jgi:hypothetical protein